MTQRMDDLEAVRVLVSALQPFNAVDRERILRWSREKLGLGETGTATRAVSVAPAPVESVASLATPQAKKTAKRSRRTSAKKSAVKPADRPVVQVVVPATKPASVKGVSAVLPVDFKSYSAARAAKSDTQFAAVVAHYLRNLAPKSARRASISSADFTDACEAIGRTKPSQPNVTLHNAQHGGVLRKGSKRGCFVLSPEGERVAVALESAAPVAKVTKAPQVSKAAKAPARKTAKKVVKKVSKK